MSAKVFKLLLNETGHCLKGTTPISLKSFDGVLVIALLIISIGMPHYHLTSLDLAQFHSMEKYNSETCIM